MNPRTFLKEILIIQHLFLGFIKSGVTVTEIPQIVDNNNQLSESESTGSLHIFNNLTRCSTTQFNLSKETLLYSWDLKGFLDYYAFMRKFDQIFEIKTEEINFKSDIVDGKWFFKLNRIINSESPLLEDIVISSTYSYEAKQAKKLHFYIQFSLVQNEQEVVLPVKKSTNPMVMQQRLYNRRGYSSYLEYVHTFTWANLGSAIQNVLSNSGNKLRNEDIVEAQDYFDETVILRFRITAYYPTDPVYNGSENCEALQADANSKNTNGKMNIPPYVKHSNSMLHDDRFSDIVLRSGNNTFPAHQIILATSSPILSSMIYNATEGLEFPLDNKAIKQVSNNNTTDEDSSRLLLKRSPEIEMNTSFDSDVIEQLLRYIYTGRVSLDKMANQLLVAANTYELPDLKKICEKYLISTIRPETAIEMYIVGHQSNSSKLTKKAFSIMKTHKSKIVTQTDEFRNLSIKHPDLMFALFLTSS